MTCPRQEREELEKILVGDFGVRAADSHGRRRAEEEDPVRTCFQRDADRITHSKAFRRLKHKTQVFLQPEGDHYRTRLTHTLEVTRLARTVGRALRLNEDLCEAIALGHDLGHTPFGRSTKFTAPASGTTSSRCAWWTASKRTAGGSISARKRASAFLPTQRAIPRRVARPSSCGCATMWRI